MVAVVDIAGIPLLRATETTTLPIKAAVIKMVSEWNSLCQPVSGTQYGSVKELF
jgi:hypothetical protein